VNLQTTEQIKLLKNAILKEKTKQKQTKKQQKKTTKKQGSFTTFFFSPFQKLFVETHHLPPETFL